MGFFENIFGDSFEIAYKEGVEQTSSVINTYVDPDDFEDALASVGIDYDSLSHTNSFEDNHMHLSFDEAERLRQSMGEVLEASLEKQQPGLTQALLDKYEAIQGTKTDTGSLAYAIMSKGPLAIDNIPLNGKIYGIAALPSESIDSKNETIDFFLHGSDLDNSAREEIKNNMSGSNEDWAKIIGLHEGQHLDAKDTGDGSVSTLKSEAEADRRIISEIRSSINETSNTYTDSFEEEPDRIDPEMLLALKDLRALSDSTHDPEHATGVLLDSGDPASVLHIEVAKIYKQSIYDEVDQRFDFATYKGEAKDATSLLKENPELFFTVINDGLDKLREDSINNYNKNPSSYEIRGSTVGAQILTDSINDFEDAYRRRVLDQDVPEKLHSAQFLPQNIENEFYADLKHENALRAVEQEDRNKSFLYKNEAFENIDWKTYEGKATTPEELYEKDKGAYYTAIHNHLKTIKETAIEEYGKNPSQENLVNMIEVEHIFNRNASTINYGMKLALGENSPQLSIENFVPEDKKREYYEGRLAIKEAEQAIKATTKAQKKTEADAEKDQTQKNNSEGDKPSNDSNSDLSVKQEGNEYKQGVGGTAYTAQINLKESGEPNVDFEKGVTVAGLPVGDFFAKNAAPATEEVKLVNAINPETPDISTISQTQENNLTTQNLG